MEYLKDIGFVFLYFSSVIVVFSTLAEGLLLILCFSEIIEQEECLLKDKRVKKLLLILPIPILIFSCLAAVLNNFV